MEAAAHRTVRPAELPAATRVWRLPSRLLLGLTRLLRPCPVQPFYYTLLNCSSWELTSTLEVSESVWVARVHVVNSYRKEVGRCAAREGERVAAGYLFVCVPLSCGGHCAWRRCMVLLSLPSLPGWGRALWCTCYVTIALAGARLPVHHGAAVWRQIRCVGWVWRGRALPLLLLRPCRCCPPS